MDVPPASRSSLPTSQNVISPNRGEQTYYLVTFLRDSLSHLTVLRHTCVNVWLYLWRRHPWLQPTGQVKGWAAAQGWQSSEGRALPPPHSSHYAKSPSLLHPPPPFSLTSASIHWPGKYLVSPSHQERRWPLLRLQTAEILSQLQDYYLLLVAGEHCGSVVMPASAPCSMRKNESKACGGDVDSTHAHFPVCLNSSRQTLAPIQAPFWKVQGNTGKWPIQSWTFVSFLTPP